MAGLRDYTVSTAIKDVYIICKSHLDIGFTDLARRVRRSYLEEFIPKAVALGRKLRGENAPENFVWNTGSWLLHEYWRTAKGRRREEFDAAVRDGIIAWHALPFTTHTELADPELYASGIGMARELDDYYGKNTVAGKMTDVPGHTTGLVPVLAANGVEFLHLGVNPASPAPAVPPLFRWRREGREVLTMYAAGDYGADVDFPAWGVKVVFAHGGDNSAPMSLGAVRQLFREMRLEYPAARIRMVTLDDLARLLLPHRETFPVFSGEIGDSWIHGVGTDPGKVAAFRELSRCRRRWLAEGRAAAEELAAFDRNMLLVCEHTWGMDIKTHLSDDHTWLRPDFDRARQVHPAYAAVEASWREQRDYLRKAVALLPAALRLDASAALQGLKPRRRQAGPMQKRPPEIVTERFRAKFNDRGEITVLTGPDGAEWPAPALLYRQYSRREVDRWLGEYCRKGDAGKAAWSFWDMGKMELPPAAPSLKLRGESARFAVCAGNGRCRVDVDVAMPEAGVSGAGCPEGFELRYVFDDLTGTVDIQVQWFGKPANRMPEAIFLEFKGGFGAGKDWRMNKFGSAVAPEEVVRDGGVMLHAVADTESLTVGRLTVESSDAPLLLLGDNDLWRYVNRPPRLDRGFRFCLYNNQWGTNFPMWYDRDGLARFRLRSL